MSDTLIPTAMNVAEYDFTDAFEYETQPDLTYKLNPDKNKISGYADQQEAYKQAVYKLLSTERYEHIIYSWNYGVELKDLFGQPIPYVVPELERRITEAVMQDDRTKSVDNFEFDTSKFGIVAVKFRANSIYGEVEITKTIEV